MLVEIAIVFVLGAGIAGYIATAYARRHLADELEGLRTKASGSIEHAKSEAATQSSATITAAKEAALVADERFESDCAALESELSANNERVGNLETEIDNQVFSIDERAQDIDARFKEAKRTRDDARRVRKRVHAQKATRIEALASKSGEEPGAIADALGNSWLESARTEATHAVRAVEQAAQDQIFTDRANRLLEVAVGRYRNHFLTERGISNLQLSERTAELLLTGGAENSEILQDVANVKFNVAESGDSLRLEGLDGVGREIARRAVSRLNRKPEQVAKAKADVRSWAEAIKRNLEAEIIGLGKKAFSVLKIPKAHPEIVDLVGRLNYRTSYTQNQWLHAVEASFLASMIGDEMGLDRKLMRRATLMHDIGKALTHKMEGSHAVIGADIARRLGEDEVVANAIGSHHADEPPNSVYAFLVAGADAMSGARPGARREHTEGYSGRLQDMERIGARHRGVDQAFAVHGGRELRVYVQDNRVSDLEAVEMSQSIAQEISDEMTFPGQIKVTVIRASESVAVAS